MNAVGLSNIHSRGQLDDNEGVGIGEGLTEKGYKVRKSMGQSEESLGEEKATGNSTFRRGGEGERGRECTSGGVRNSIGQPWLFHQNSSQSRWRDSSNPLTSFLHFTVGQINQKTTQKYWATRSSVRSFARTAHLFACSALHALLERSTVLTRSLACSLRSIPCSWESE